MRKIKSPIRFGILYPGRFSRYADSDKWIYPIVGTFELIVQIGTLHMLVSGERIFMKLFQERTNERTNAIKSLFSFFLFNFIRLTSPASFTRVI